MLPPSWNVRGLGGWSPPFVERKEASGMLIPPFACVRGLGGCTQCPGGLRSHAGLLTATMRFRYLYEDNRN